MWAGEGWGQSQAENMRSASPDWVGFQHTLLLDAVLFLLGYVPRASDGRRLPAARAHSSQLKINVAQRRWNCGAIMV